MKVGFIGQGFIGGNMANEFETRRYQVVRYSKNKFPENLKAMQECEFVFIAVPTPSIDRKFDDSTLLEAVKNTVPGQKIVIKSTVIVGTTDKLQKLYPDRYFFHSAEFLTERDAAYDVENPTRNVIGSTYLSKPFEEQVAALLPRSPGLHLVTAKESELGKYFSNFLLTTKVIMANIMYDICDEIGVDYNKIKFIAGGDPRIGLSHLEVDFEGGRGANGHCFPKDLSAVHEMYGELPASEYSEGEKLLELLETYNLALNIKTGKQLDILKQVYGKDFDRVKNDLSKKTQ